MTAENRRFWLRLSAVLWLLFGAASLFAQGNSEGKGKPPFPRINLDRQVRGEEAVRALGARLPEVAAWYGKSTNELAKLLRHDRNLWVSPGGRLTYLCELETPLPEGANEAGSPTRTVFTPVTFALDQTFKLHSLPGSQKVIYLDFNGETVTGTAWNSNYNGGAAIVAAPFNFEGDSATFSSAELQRIQNIWKRVAEDYAPFDVDVTTEEPPVDALRRTNSSDSQFGNRVIITPTNFYPNVGGVSYVGSFDDVGDTYKISWAFSNTLQNSEKYIAEACSHENGHAVGLHHEGITGGAAYYQGQGDWAPIMGNSYYKNVTQWAKGEYEGANNKEDQLLVMQTFGLAYYTDDHGNSANTATVLPAGSSVSASGFIERNTDLDVFKFAAGSGAVALNVNPAAIGPDLKILAELRDISWNLITSSGLSNLGASLSANISTGNYFVTVRGTGSGDPLTDGYSNYASLGQFVISGTVPNPGSAPPPAAAISATPASGEAPLAVAFSGSASTSASGITSYAWNFGDGSSASGVSVNHTYSSAGSFNVTLTVTDGNGLTDSASTTIVVTRDIYVSSIVMSSASSPTAVSASAAVTIKDLIGNPVSGATVVAAWSGVVTGTSTVATNSSGVANLASPQSSISGTFTLTITVVAASGCTYNAQLNIQTSASIAASLDPGTTPGSVSGRIVRDSDGSGIPGVAVLAYDAGWNLLKTEMGNSSGDYAIADLPPGTYYLKTYSTQGFADEFYSNASSMSAANAVTVTPGGNTGGINFSLCPKTESASAPIDFDGDGKSDIAVWRPDSGTWYSLASGTPGSYQHVSWGLPTDVPMPGDYDGDGITDAAAYRPSTGTWYILPSASPGTYQGVQWGLTGDVPVPADYDGDGKTDVAVWRPSSGVWYVLPSASPGTFTGTFWGASSDIPLAADYDGDGKADAAVWRPGTGVWYALPSTAPGTYTATHWGVSSDIPVPGDYDGDRKTDVAVWRPGTGVWYILSSAIPGAYDAVQWGQSGDKPALGDYDGDGKADIAIWQPATGVWYVLLSGSPGTYTSGTWGLSTDVPVSSLTAVLRALP